MITPPALPGEQWRAVTLHGGVYADNYYISSLGRLWSRPRMGARGGLLRTRVSRYGYAIVRLSVDAREKECKIHVLVAHAFLGERPFLGAHICHTNGNKLDNRLSNLRYGTAAENTADLLSHGRHFNASKTHCMRGHLFDEANTIVAGPSKRSCRECRRLRDRSPERVAAHRARARSKAAQSRRRTA